MNKNNKLSQKQIAILFLAGFFSLVDLVDSFLIHLKEFKAKSDPTVLASCKISAVLDCAPVVSSRYSQFMGVPVSLVGIIFSEAIFILCLIVLFGFKLQRWQIWLISLAFIPAIGFSYYLLFMSYFGLGVFCPYCLVSNVATTGMTISWFVFIYNLNKAKYSVNLI